MRSTMNRSSQWVTEKQAMLEQLMALEDIRSKQIEQYVLQHTIEHKRLEQLLDQYIKHIQALLAMNEPPREQLVLLNHEIEIEYVEDGFIDKLCIVLPHEIDPESGKISLLSPVGQQLLLAPLHGELDLETPAGLARIKIITISRAAA
ncbi:hypothetical protein J40TS1_21640 [Paenibacillus montaniterrae]|uniref:Transcription elongation factor GreA/GreB C-terminal domain-containing protein n=2 Tax=Paenibacillus montaniterrae TaxID=429341 RepID=A0A920CU17_9BACL|nr:hypothetical protein J40TS1_21640 [Paenibacillus montaniterrae]